MDTIWAEKDGLPVLAPEVKLLDEVNVKHFKWRRSIVVLVSIEYFKVMNCRWRRFYYIDYGKTWKLD